MPTPVKRMCAVTIETNGGMLPLEDILNMFVARIINEKGRGQKAAGMATKLHAMVVAHGVPNSFSITRPPMLEANNSG